VAAVTAVGVLPDARRRGVLATIMREQLDLLHTTGAEPVAALWASQFPLYGRYGYGPATTAVRIEAPGRAGFRHDVDTGGRIEVVGTPPRGNPAVRAVYAAVSPGRVGWLSRADAHWNARFLDPPGDRGGASAPRTVVHHCSDGPDGYAVFRVTPHWSGPRPGHTLRVTEIVAATPQAAAALWRTLLDLDLVGQIVHHDLGPGDPLPHLLADPRPVVVGARDGFWVRLVDLDRALAARRYAAACDVVVEVADAACPWNEGRWRVRTETGGAEATRTDTEPDLRCDVGALGAAFLGGVRLTELAAAGRVTVDRPAALVALSRAMHGDEQPHCPEVF
jgi:predicted acetyltransferase